MRAAQPACHVSRAYSIAPVTRLASARADLLATLAESVLALQVQRAEPLQRVVPEPLAEPLQRVVLEPLAEPLQRVVLQPPAELLQPAVPPALR